MNKFTASDGVEVAYALDDYTDPWRPADTVILVHAAMGSSLRFYAWVPHLARDFRVARIDLRGHGATPVPRSGELSVPRLARDVVELADHLGARRFHVAGSSAGSTIAGKVAIDYPDRVLSFGAFACTGGIRHALQDQNSWVRRIGEKGLAAFLRETIADRVDLKSAAPGFVDWFIAESGKTPVAALERFVPMMREFEFVADLPRIRCPTLAVAPGGDPIHTVEHYRALPERIPDCEFVVYDGLPHNITDAVPDRCARDYRRFLLKCMAGDSPRIIAHHIAASGSIPNHPRWPLLVYPGAVAAAAADLAAAFEELFGRNGWPAAWRNGIFPFHHFHCDAHEALGVYSGEVTAQFGGDDGIVITARPGDVIVLPAGTGHKKLSARGALGIVGAYPAGQHPDMCTPLPSSLQHRAAAVARVALPQRDPVHGEGGPLFAHWK